MLANGDLTICRSLPPFLLRSYPPEKYNTTEKLRDLKSEWLAEITPVASFAQSFAIGAFFAPCE
eukprot:8457859-Pyramimonas_sp.AAC.1